MELLINIVKKFALIIIMISILITFFATPASYAKLDLQDGEFYYSGTTKGTYTVKDGIFAWLLSCIGDIADWILGIITLGFRMVFVGWTALLEKMLTWALESTTGVSVDGSVVESSTDLTSLTDSSNNVTVEAIVYNKVPALDINIFDLEFDRTVSGTGQQLICTCGNPVDQCVTLTQDEAQAVVDGTSTTTVSNLCVSTCDCGGCDACLTYVKQLAAEEPIVIKIKTMVATWYNIIRLIATAAMLVVLIAIGIKMAASTIAQDKAVYKRMLVDWVVGLIMLFTLHYFMLFVISMNEVVVGIVEESANSINATREVKMMQLSDSESEFTDSELEIKVYEEIRTKAYDAKLLNGIIGLVMYMTLVFFAFKYTLIYLKRYLTIIVLTLMAPGVGLAYALQKALSGKSHALKTWMTEYIMNVIIQIVHALIYAIFISQALVLSLENITGMIIALILMNYAAKADELFKKIFKFGGGDSLLGHTEGASDAFRNNLKTAKGLAMGAKPMAKALTNTPYGKAVKATGKAALAATVGAAKGVKSLAEAVKGTEGEQHERAIEKEMDRHGDGYARRENESDEDYESRRSSAEEKVNAKEKRKQEKADKKQGIEKPSDKELLATGGEELREQMLAARKALEAEGDKPNEDTVKRYENSVKNYNRFQQLQMPSSKQIAKGHVERLVSMENVFTTSRNVKSANFALKHPKMNAKKKAMAEKHPNISKAAGAVSRGIGTAATATFGTTHFDKKNLRFTNDGNGVYNQFSASNLLGFTDADKKQFKELTKSMRNGLLGMGSLFLGMGTIVANPAMGMGLLAAGTSMTKGTFGRNRDISSYSSSGKYTFSRFEAGALEAISNSALARSQFEHNAILNADISSRHPKFANMLKNGGIAAVTLGVPAGIAGVAFAPAMVMGGIGAISSARFFGNTALHGKLDEIDKHHTRQQKQQIEQFREETEEEILTSILAGMEARDAILEERDQKIQAEYEREEFEKLGIKVSSDDSESVMLFTSEDDVDENSIKTEIGTKKITTTDIAIINREIDSVVLELSSGQEIDMSSQKTQSDAMKMLTERLQKTGILSEGQSAEAVFKTGKTGLKEALKKKSDASNERVQEANKKLAELVSPQEAVEITTAVSSIVQEKGKEVSSITVEEVIDKLNPSKDGSRQVNTSDGSRNVNPTGGDGSQNANSSQTGNGISQQQTTSENDRKQAIAQYLQSIQASSPKTKRKEITRDESDKLREEATSRTKARMEDKKKRKDKLQQVMAAAIGTLETSEPSGSDKEKKIISKEASEKVLEVLLSQKGEKTITVDGKTIELSAAESDYVTGTVKNLLELKALNEESLKMRTSEIKYGPEEFLKATSEKSSLAIEIAKLEQEQIRLDGVDSTQLSDEEKNKKKSQIDGDIEKKRKELESTKERMKVKGPVVDINAVINGLL